MTCTRELAAEGHLLRLWRPPLAPGEWRTDEVTPLSVHPNDPGAAHAREGSEADEGRLVRLWTPPNPPGRWRTMSLLSAHDDAELVTTLESLPLYGWMNAESAPLSVHPNDPANGTGS